MVIITKKRIYLCIIVSLALMLFNCAPLKAEPENNANLHASVIQDVNEGWKFDHERLAIINAALAQKNGAKAEYMHAAQKSPLMRMNLSSLEWFFDWEGERYGMAEGSVYAYRNFFGSTITTERLFYIVYSTSGEILFRWQKFITNGVVTHVLSFSGGEGLRVDMYTEWQGYEMLMFDELQAPYRYEALMLSREAFKTMKVKVGDVVRWTSFAITTRDINVNEAVVKEKNGNITESDPWVYKVDLNIDLVDFGTKVLVGNLYYASDGKVLKGKIAGIDMIVTNLMEIAKERGIELTKK